MKRKLASSGYTIVEVLIVLAVSGALLVSVMALISGQQAKTEFTAALRDFESRLQDIMNDVSTGTYPEPASQCLVGSEGPVATGESSAGQGTSQACLFVGKAMQFSPVGSGAANDAGKYNLFTIVGRRAYTEDNEEKEPRNIQQSMPRIISTDSAETDFATLNSSLEFKEIFTGGPDAKESTYGLAFVASFGHTPAANIQIKNVSGSSLMRIPGINSAGTNASQVQAAVVNLSTPDNLITDSVTFCIGDAGDNSDNRLGAVRLNGGGTEILFDKDAIDAGCEE